MIKKINPKKGISLIVLLITIVVILILLTAITFSADNVVNNTKKRQFAKEIYEVQNLVDKYKYENDDYPYIIENDEKKVININVENIDEQFVGEDIINNTVTLYPIDLSKAGVQNLSRGTKKDNNENDVYAFSNQTGKVYYVKGYKVEKNVYYTLNNELKKLIGLKTEYSSNSNVKIEYEINIGDRYYIYDGLVLYLDGIENTRKGHNEKTNIWEDLSGKEKDCNLINFSYDEESGWGKNGLIFDGNDDGVYLDNKLKDLFKEDFSIEFLLSCDEQNTRDVLMGNYSVSQNINFENYYNSFRLYWNGGVPDIKLTSNFFEAYKEVYICITLDKNNGILKIYKDGNLINTITNSLFTSYNYDYINAYIGRDNRTGTTNFKGIINSVRIYTKQLTQEEIDNNYKRDKERFNF